MTTNDSRRSHADIRYEACNTLRILILNCDYPRFLRQLYVQAGDLHMADYRTQMEARNASLFGVADFYSHGFRTHGHEAAELHVNNAWLQAAWAREHGLPVDTPPPPDAPDIRTWLSARRVLPRRLLQPLVRRFMPRQLGSTEAAILRAQIEDFQPDVILNQEMGYVRSDFLRSLKSKRLRIVGQIAAARPMGEDFRVYDLVVSSLPNFVTWFSQNGVRAKLNRLAFDPRVLEKVKGSTERDIFISFVGSLSIEHRSRIELLEFLAQHTDLQLWGNGIEGVPRGSPLHRCYRGEAWGKKMYEILMRSRITINHHIDLSEGYANNMRLYEATGCGALMLVDAKRNLHEIFDEGREVATYASKEECLAKIKHYLSQEDEHARVAEAGQLRTIREHNYVRRTGELAAIIADC